MKYKLLGFLTLIFLFIATILAEAFDGDQNKNRTHQHQIARQPGQVCDCNGTELCTHLPLVVIDTLNGEEVPGSNILDENGKKIGKTVTSTGEEMLKAKISIMSNEEKNHHPSDIPDLSVDTMIRIRGTSSRYYDKKNYLLRFVNEDGTYRNEPVMGMDRHFEWALHGPYIDKSLIRNYMWYNIAGEIMEYAPNVRFCELIINGEYLGVYLMTETITNGKKCRLNIAKPMTNVNKTGYLLRLDRGSDVEIKNINVFTKYTYRNVQQMDVKYPKFKDLTPGMIKYIVDDFSHFEKSLYSFDYDDEKYGYYNRINISSFVDYFILNEFTLNYDAGWLSTYIYRDIVGKYNMVIWDFNSSMNNYADVDLQTNNFLMQHNIWYFMLTKDKYFTDRIIDRYRELRKDVLSEEYLEKYVDDVIAYLDDAVERNFEVWQNSFEKDLLKPKERNIRSYDEAIAQIKEFLRVRGNWLDENIEIINQYSHESRNRKFNY